MTPGNDPHLQAAERGSASPVPVTYGELMDGARLCAARAQRAIARTPFADAEAARYVLTARSRLLTAVAHHAEVALGTGVVQAWRESAPASRGVEERDRRVRYALAWIDSLASSSATLDDRDGPRRRSPGGRSPECIWTGPESLSPPRAT